MGSLYDYFPNKDSLVVALIENHAREMAAVVETNFGPDAGLPLPIAVRSWVQEAANAHLANPDLNRVLIGQIPRVTDLDVLREAENRIASLLRLYLERRAEEPRDPSLAGFVVAQAVMSLAHKAVTTRPEAFADGRLAEETTNLVLGYLSPPSR